MNDTLALTLAQTGRIFVSNMNRREAWHTAKTFTISMGMRVKQFAVQHVDEKGNRYDGYELLIVQDIPINSFSNVCPSYGEAPSFKVRQAWKDIEQQLQPTAKRQRSPKTEL
jgi:hypothetical protein